MKVVVMVIIVVDKIPNDFKNQSASNANVKDIFLMECVRACVRVCECVCVCVCACVCVRV